MIKELRRTVASMFRRLKPPAILEMPRWGNLNQLILRDVAMRNYKCFGNNSACETIRYPLSTINYYGIVSGLAAK
ncbi:MAG: hypothetical protein LBP87_05120 [Planctomycetaceae bacterium]|nr:hypothetical protein [Planctomycetaceae bacterium]